MSFNVAGIQVEFPFEPYVVQHEFMSTLIRGLERSENCLLENPTGTGKTLSLLCASLAWQSRHREKVLEEYKKRHANNEKPTGILETDIFKLLDTSNFGAAMKLIQVPTIYYATRTHSQIKNVIKELRKSSYTPKMAVLGSRQHYCVNPSLHYSKNKNEECQTHLKEKSCFYADEHTVPKLAKKMESMQIWDMEDMMDEGRKVEGCPYFASQMLAETAEIVFCPYNYVMDKNIRHRVKIELANNVFIFDEAHNIEDVSRSVATFSANSTLFLEWAEEIESALEVCEQKNQAVESGGTLVRFVKKIHEWTQKTKVAEYKNDTFANVYDGDRMFAEFAKWDVTPSTFHVFGRILNNLFEMVGKVDPLLISAKTSTDIAKLFSCISYCFHGFLEDYRLILTLTKDKHILVDLTCLSPKVSFNALKNEARCIVLTSGTLSPMNGFQSELDMKFPHIYEGIHVIDMKNQICAHSIGYASDGTELLLNFKESNDPKIQNGTGALVESYCKTIDAGILCFFPSYSMMEKMLFTWKKQGIMDRIAAVKTIFKEPRKMDNPEEFTLLLQRYDSEIEQCTQNPRNDRKGAIFFAVCRGKVSEGLDFSDNKARAVIVIGIPFPSLMDIQIDLKKDFNDKLNATKKIHLNGQQWYTQQAYRAVNQAIGRCIRHRNDYGAIFLIDKRYTQGGTVNSLSKWLRSSITSKKSNDSISDVVSFFQRIKIQETKKHRPHLTIEIDKDSRKKPKFDE